MATLHLVRLALFFNWQNLARPQDGQSRTVAQCRGESASGVVAAVSGQTSSGMQAAPSKQRPSRAPSPLHSLES